jgi:hypothetical protein
MAAVSFSSLAGQNWLITPAALAQNEPTPASILDQRWIIEFSGVGILDLEKEQLERLAAGDFGLLSRCGRGIEVRNKPTRYSRANLALWDGVTLHRCRTDCALRGRQLGVREIIGRSGLWFRH